MVINVSYTFEVKASMLVYLLKRIQTYSEFLFSLFSNDVIIGFLSALFFIFLSDYKSNLFLRNIFY